MVQHDIKAKTWEIVQPSSPLPNSVDTSPIVFHIPESFHYTLLNESFYYIKFRLVYSDLSALAETRHVALQNFAPVICFADQTVSINGKVLENHDGQGHYINYLKTLLCASPEAKEGVLKQALWLPDEPALMTDDTDIGATSNKNLKTRNRLIEKSRQCEAVCPLGFDIAGTGRLFPPSTAMTITFQRTPSTVCIIGKANTADEGEKRIILEIQQMELLVRRVEPYDDTSKQLQQLLHSPLGLIYPFVAWRPRVFNIPKSVSTLDAVCFTNGIIPQRLIVVVIETTRKNGLLTNNSMKFAPNGVKAAYVERNGVRLPNTGISFGEDDVMKALLHFEEAFGFSSDFGIDCSKYETTHFILAWDLSEARNAASKKLLAKQEVGTVKLHLDLEAPTSQELSVLAFGEFVQTVQLQKDRSVTYMDMVSVTS